jgi:hypothetical protein
VFMFGKNMIHHSENQTDNKRHWSFPEKPRQAIFSSATKAESFKLCMQPHNKTIRKKLQVIRRFVITKSYQNLKIKLGIYPQGTISIWPH